MNSNPSIVQFKTVAANPDLEIVQDIAASELAQILVIAEHGQAPIHVIDVRMPDEFVGELGHIAGARLIPLPELPGHLAELPKDETVVFVCKSGGRSTRATAFAMSNGLENVYNMKGGMLHWNDLHLPVER